MINMAGEESSVPVVAVTAAVGAVVLLLVFLCSVSKKTQDDKEEPVVVKKKSKESADKTNASKKPKLSLKQKRSGNSLFTHPWVASALKAHGASILDMDFSQNGKYLITVAEDRSAMIWSVKDFTRKEHRFIRANIEYDHATRVMFSPDTKAFIVVLANENILRIYRIGKKDDGSPGNITAAFDFPKLHSADVIHIGVASNGRFIMICYSNTIIHITTIKGEILATLDTHQVNNTFAAVSFCGRFIGSVGFTPDVKVWEVCYDKNRLFKEVSRAFELKGHMAGVRCFSFNYDSSRMASVSKDGTWKFWDTDVQYQLQQEPYLLFTGKFHSDPTYIALSPDGRTVAMSHSNTIALWNTVSKKCDQVMENVHYGPVVGLSFSSSGKYLVSLGDKHAIIFHNVTGYKATIEDLEGRKQKASSNTAAERIQLQIDETKAALDEINLSKE